MLVEYERESSEKIVSFVWKKKINLQIRSRAYGKSISNCVFLLGVNFFFCFLLTLFLFIYFIFIISMWFSYCWPPLPLRLSLSLSTNPLDQNTGKLWVDHFTILGLVFFVVDVYVCMWASVLLDVDVLWAFYQETINANTNFAFLVSNKVSCLGLFFTGFSI